MSGVETVRGSEDIETSLFDGMGIGAEPHKTKSALKREQDADLELAATLRRIVATYKQNPKTAISMMKTISFEEFLLAKMLNMEPEFIVVVRAAILSMIPSLPIPVRTSDRHLKAMHRKAMKQLEVEESQYGLKVSFQLHDESKPGEFVIAEKRYITLRMGVIHVSESETKMPKFEKWLETTFTARTARNTGCRVYSQTKNPIFAYASAYAVQEKTITRKP